MRWTEEIAYQADEDLRSKMLMSSDHQNCARVNNYFEKQHNSLALFFVPFILKGPLRSFLPKQNRATCSASSERLGHAGRIRHCWTCSKRRLYGRAFLIC